MVSSALVAGSVWPLLQTKLVITRSIIDTRLGVSR
jgi:hypothetical protein